MTLMQWFIFFLMIQVIHGLGTWKLYIKAGRQAWEAFIPVYNAIVLMKIINRSTWWTILLFLPIINLIMFPVVWVETARSFGKNSTTDTVLAVVTLGLYNYYINYMMDVTYINDRDLNPKSSAGDWISSILFAVVAATIVHTYFIQPFTIPTSSLEKSLLVGDYLFVSKMHYGARTPMTTIAAPMVHDAIPFTAKKSYVTTPQLPYFRFPSLQSIKRNDIVVFNWPVDTLTVITDPNSAVLYKPVDKKSNYVKRCVGIPGDSLEVRNGYVFINDVQNEVPDRARLQFSYNITFKGQFSNEDVNRILLRYNLTDGLGWDKKKETYYVPAATQEDVAKARNHPNIESIELRKEIQGERDASVFPHSPDYSWNNDFFGPIYIPEAGKTIDINLEVLPLYKRLITEYEGNNLRVEGNQIFINDALASTYTFKQDYYWMMGDNRNNSQDARSWGFVPFDHVVGKPVFIWLSLDKNKKGLDKIRWERMFTTVHGSGNPVSYLIPFIVLLLGWFGFNTWRKRKKAK